MVEVISSNDVKARKEHECGLCTEKIQKGETYNNQTCKFEGSIYTFKAHTQCKEIASMLWNYIDPDEGMTDQDFLDGVQEYCYGFVCSHCEKYIDEDCSIGNSYCLDKVHTRLKEKGLKWEGYRWVERN